MPENISKHFSGVLLPLQPGGTYTETTAEIQLLRNILKCISIGNLLVCWNMQSDFSPLVDAVPRAPLLKIST